MCGCLSHDPYWGPGLQPRCVPWLGIKPVTLWFAGGHSFHWATPARANSYFQIYSKENFICTPHISEPFSEHKTRYVLYLVKRMRCYREPSGISTSDSLYWISISSFVHCELSWLYMRVSARARHSSPWDKKVSS